MAPSTSELHLLQLLDSSCVVHSGLLGGSEPEEITAWLTWGWVSMALVEDGGELRFGGRHVAVGLLEYFYANVFMLC